MKIQFKQDQAFHNFHLTEPIEHHGNLMVLTGINGCGKTRFLKALTQGTIECEIDDEKIVNNPSNIIVLVDGSEHRDIWKSPQKDSAKLLEESLLLFNKIGTRIDDEFINMDQATGNLGIGKNSLFVLCHSIAKKYNKRPSQLSHNEIRLNFTNPNVTPYFGKKLNNLINEYHQRLVYNELCELKSLYKSGYEDLKFYSETDFTKEFHIPPWKLLSETIDLTFSGKYALIPPDLTLETFDYAINIIEVETGKSITPEIISSGESSLFWLTFTLVENYYQYSFSKARILLLDEPDCHLHPSMVPILLKGLEKISNLMDLPIILTTHSPTTVALVNDSDLYEVTSQSIKTINKDSAISSLLRGLSHISIDPHNRRNIVVESLYDHCFYEELYLYLAATHTKIDKNISLNFMPSGPKLDEQRITSLLRKYFGTQPPELISGFSAHLNGIGNCDQTIGMVKALNQNGSGKTKGIIDWDNTNQSDDNIHVLAENLAYTIENIALDPLAIFFFLNHNDLKKYPIPEKNGQFIARDQALNDPKTLQKITDYVIGEITGKTSDREVIIEYRSGVCIQSDSSWLRMDGKVLQKHILKKFPELRSLTGSRDVGYLKTELLKTSMLSLSNGRLIPKALIEAIEFAAA